MAISYPSYVVYSIYGLDQGSYWVKSIDSLTHWHRPTDPENDLSVIWIMIM